MILSLYIKVTAQFENGGEETINEHQTNSFPIKYTEIKKKVLQDETFELNFANNEKMKNVYTEDE